MKIETLLRNKIGLNPDSIGKKKIESDIRRCMGEAGMTDEKEYVRLLQTSTAELEKLIEAITVPETWFFRNRGAFEYLAAHVRNEWLPGHRKPALRILSVPCASGEEAYSVAMTLLNAGMLPEQFHIDAIDVSKKVLADAERAVYGKNSFRGKDLTFRKQFFHEKENSFQLRPEVKQSVNFIYDNILAPFFLSNTDPYDVIFCRNLLIYFDRAAQQRAMRVLSRLLKQNGLLFVGHAETGLFTDNTFSPVRHSGVFAFHKASNPFKNTLQNAGAAKRIPRFYKTPNKGLLSQPRCAPKVSAATSNIASVPDPAIVSKTTIDAVVKKAWSLADEGQLFEAAELCEIRLKEDHTDTEAYCLMGLIRLALNDDSAAEQYFNKVVFLNPNHYEALVHLALLSEHRGDKQNALMLQQRAERAKRNQENKEVGN